MFISWIELNLLQSLIFSEVISWKGFSDLFLIKWRLKFREPKQVQCVFFLVTLIGFASEQFHLKINIDILFEGGKTNAEFGLRLRSFLGLVIIPLPALLFKKSHRFMTPNHFKGSYMQCLTPSHAYFNAPSQ